MELFPAIDLRAGAAVRLAQGDFGRQSDYGDPLALARRYAEAGARWVHVVDLDGARTGTAANRVQVLAIAAATPASVQAGGGVRSAPDAEELLGGGVARVVLGTAALSDPGLLGSLAERFPGQVAVGIDHRGGGADVAVDGWTRPSGTTLSEALARLDGLALAAVIVTAIEHDGVLSGPDIPGLEAVLGLCAHPVIASGGVRSVADLRALAALSGGGRGLAGVIVGRALVDGTLDVEEAVAACATSG
ncbi:MAG TPA: HisA/HisF-related TIM barrel protein [Acidimicrobiales bacterium]|nr:HisA/HisF-related TIM barrel protein [Acidimicrobiales bacterium]